MRIYIAAPFFNVHQVSVVEKIKKILESFSIEYFSPKDELGILEGRESTNDQRQAIFEGNCKGIEFSGLVIAVIDDFDKGVLWEMGYAYAKGKKILVYSDVSGRGMNIMLSQSSVGMVNGIDQLQEWLKISDQFIEVLRV